MKKSIFTILIVIAAIALTSCGKSIDYELPADAAAFNTGTFINPDNKDDTYQSIEYGGRTYIPYGTLKKGIDSDDTGRCLEYEYWKKSP